MRNLLPCIALLAGLFAVANAADDKNSQSPTGDQEFVLKASEIGLAEIELGKLALARSTSELVKEFGQKMIVDHAKANQELAVIAQSKGLRSADKLDAEHQKLYADLSTLQGADFDRTYAKNMVKGHTHAVNLFRKQLESAQDPALKGFAKRTLPVIEEHLKSSTDLHRKVNKE